MKINSNNDSNQCKSPTSSTSSYSSNNSKLNNNSSNLIVKHENMRTSSTSSNLKKLKHHMLLKNTSNNKKRLSDIINDDEQQQRIKTHKKKSTKLVLVIFVKVPRPWKIVFLLRWLCSEPSPRRGHQAARRSCEKIPRGRNPRGIRISLGRHVHCEQNMIWWVVSDDVVISSGDEGALLLSCHDQSAAPSWDRDWSSRCPEPLFARHSWLQDSFLGQLCTNLYVHL